MNIHCRYKKKDKAYVAEWFCPIKKANKTKSLGIKGEQTAENEGLALIKLTEITPSIEALYETDFNNLSLLQLFTEYEKFNVQWTTKFSEDWRIVILRADNAMNGRPIKVIGSYDLPKYMAGSFTNDNTQHKHAKRIRGMLSHFYRHKKLTEDYSLMIKVKGETPRGIECMPTEPEIGMFLKVDDKLFTDAFTFMLVTGGRQEDIFSTKGNEFYEVEKQIRRNEDDKASCKRMPRRDVPDLIVPMLGERKQQYGNGYLFQNDNGTRMTVNDFYEMFRRYAKQLGISDKRIPYGLRHAFCAKCYKEHLPEEITAALMGHTSVSMVRKVYSHLKELLGEFRPHLNRVWDRLPD